MLLSGRGGGNGRGARSGLRWLRPLRGGRRRKGLGATARAPLARARALAVAYTVHTLRVRRFAADEEDDGDEGPPRVALEEFRCGGAVGGRLPLSNLIAVLKSVSTTVWGATNWGR